MLKKILLGVLAMSVSASVVFGKTTNGLIQSQGFAMEQKGKDVKTSLDEDLFYEPNSTAIMLRPDLELKSCGGSSPNFTDGDGFAVNAAPGTWELVTMPGMPELKLLHQKDITQNGWMIVSEANWGENQGFVCYFDKYALSSAITGIKGLAFWLIGTDNIFSVYFYDRKYILIQFVYGSEVPQKTTKEIPANFFGTDNVPINFFAVMFIDNKIILGINGFTNSLCFELSKYPLTTDSKGTSYPKIIEANSYFKLQGSGGGVFGFKGIKYATPKGDLTSPWFMPGVDPSASTTAKITKKIIPAGTSITGAFAGGKPVEIEGTGGSGTSTGRLRYGFSLRGDGSVTPYVYGWRVKDPLVRISATSSPYTLTGDLLSYSEDITGNKDGSFGDWTSHLAITCYATYYDNIFTSRNAQMAITLNPGTGATLRATHFADTLTVTREDFGKFNLDVSGQSIVKRLKLTPILRAESFDDRSWRHGDLMKYLCYDLGGVTLTASDYTADPLLPASQEKDRANWQFNPGTSIWDAMETVRKYSGWILYPNNAGAMLYKPMPTSADTADWTINMDDTVLNCKYTIGDLAKTRFMVLGQAGKDDTAGRYKKGDGLLVYKTNSTLEEQIGESRPLWIFDPALSSTDVVNKMCKQLYDYYTTLHKIISFEIQDFKTYKTMQLFQVLSITDAKVPDVSGKYLITGIHITADLSMMSGTLEAISL